MKTKFAFLGMAVFLVFGLALTGCGDDDSSNPLAGMTWKNASIGTITFKSNLTCTFVFPQAADSAISGSYSVSGNIVIMTAMGGTLRGTITGNQMTVVDVDENDELGIFVKQ
jgi:hypothetical protein